MTDENPLPLKRKSASAFCDENNLKCIVHFDSCKDNEVVPLSDSQMQTIQQAAERRQLQLNPDVRYDSLCSSLPAQFIPNLHGQHRFCYKKFTNVSRLQISTSHSTPSENDDENSGVVSEDRRRSTRSVDSSTTTLLPQNSCLFCGKKFRYGGGKREVLTTCVTQTAEQSVKAAAIAKEDYTMMGIIQDVDLVAKEARYHNTCRRDYLRREDRSHHVGFSEENSAFNRESRSAHEEAFKNLCQHVESSLIDNGKVERMTMLKGRYHKFMSENFPSYRNESYSTQPLKSKLISFFGDKICFWQPQARNKSELVYSSDIDIGEAIETAFEAATSEKRILAKAAIILNRRIKETWLTSPALPWPPNASDLTNSAVSPPAVLEDFLRHTITANKSSACSDRVNRISTSIAADICAATTFGRWLMPKHVLLATSLHHLTGSAEIVTILNRYGHCQSYSKLLEFETAIAYAVQNDDDVLPSNVSPSGNIVSHLCWDNFDVNEETRSGSGTTHVTHGILIQEICPSDIVKTERISLVRSKERSFKPVVSLLPIYYSGRKVEPATGNAFGAVDDQVIKVELRQDEVMWLMCRGLLNEKCTVPSFNGWLSKIAADKCVNVSTVGYMKPIFHPATEYDTVQQCFSVSVKAMKKLNQEYTFVTFDLAMAKIAYDITWNSPEQYNKVIIHLGGFHIMCAYMAVLGKMMTGSGFEEILIDSGICASGSINQVLNGKHFNRAIRVHQHMLDAINRLILDVFVERAGERLHGMAELKDLASDPSAEKLFLIENMDSSNGLKDQYVAFMKTIRDGKFGKTAQFWVQYTDCVWNLLRFMRSIKENNLADYVTCLRNLCPLMFSADRHNYARYLPMYYMQMLHLSKNHPNAEVLLAERGISVARSQVPACRVPIDMTIEQTINRSAKTSGGVIGFTRNTGSYQRWCMTKHVRASLLDATHNAIGVDISLEKLFAYPLSPVPWSLGTPDGCFVKTEKAQLMHILESRADACTLSMKDMPFNSSVVLDGNAMFQAMVKLPDTFGELAMSVFKCLPKVQNVHFVTDSYFQGSTKDVERERRGTSKAFVIGGPLIPRNYAAFMHNSQNKKQLIRFLLEQWQTQSYVSEMSNRNVFYVCEDKCFELKVDDGVMRRHEVDELNSSHEEADTRMILHCFFASRSSPMESTVIVRSPDTDVLVLLVYYSSEIRQTLLLDTGVGNKRRLINVQQIAASLGDGVVRALPGFHAFTGCDCNSAFVRKGKKNPFKLLVNNPDFQETFQLLGQQADNESPSLQNGSAKYVCAMYGKPDEVSTNNIRSSLFQSRYGVSIQSLSTGKGCGIDMSLLPPCNSCLQLHCKRANYQSYIWKNAHVPKPLVPPPAGNGWTVDAARKLDIQWTFGDILPQDITEILPDISSLNEQGQYEPSEFEVEEDDEVDNILDIIFDDDDCDTEF